MQHCFKLLAVAGIAAALSACGDDNQPQVAVTDLATGSYIVSVGDANAPTVGKYYAGADGSRLLVLADSADHASQLYRRASAGAAWVGVPVSNQDVTVRLLRSDLLPTGTVTATALVGSYAAPIASGVTAAFSINADGSIVAGSSACKLSGTVSTGSLPATLKLTLSASGCGSLPASSTGMLAVDSDYAPASFRLVADNGAQLVDIWAYKN